MGCKSIKKKDAVAEWSALEAGKKEVFGSIVIIYTNAQRSVSLDQMLVRKNFTFGSCKRNFVCTFYKVYSL